MIVSEIAPTKKLNFCHREEHSFPEGHRDGVRRSDLHLLKEIATLRYAAFAIPQGGIPVGMTSHSVSFSLSSAQSDVESLAMTFLENIV